MDSEALWSQLKVGSMTELADLFFGRVASFIENTCVYLLKGKLPASLVVREIHKTDRRPEFPQRFEVTLASGNFVSWEIAYSDKRFDDQ